MSKIAVVDLSWIMHRYRYAHKDLSFVVDGKRIPTGHVYGTYKFVKELSERYERIILAVDSNPTIRKAILSSYKSNRVKNSGNEFDDYNIHQDLDYILALCTAIQNVSYVKKEGYEADDIIATFIAHSMNWDFYFRDNDILQTRGMYNLCVSFDDFSVGYVTDRRKHIQKKYGLDKDWLPIIWKIIKGDSGDCIPIGIKRFPTKDLIEICNNTVFESNNVTFNDCLKALKEHEYSGVWKDRMKQLFEDENALKVLETNYKLVKPMYILGNQLTISDVTGVNVNKVFARYGIQPF